jgi:hypothetical protein
MWFIISLLLFQALVPENLVFHVVTTGPDIIHAESLAVEMREHFSTCFPSVSHDIKAFLLPPDRGEFFLNMLHAYNNYSGESS